MTDFASIENTNIDDVIANINFTGETIRFINESAHGFLITTLGEFTVLITTETNSRHIIGSVHVFERVHDNLRTNTLKYDKYLSFNGERKLVYLDYNTGLFLKDTSKGVSLVFNEA